MLSSASLSAFSAAVQARRPAELTLDGIVPARAEGRAGAVAPAPPLVPAPDRPPADRNLPRGSLLDLSV